MISERVHNRVNDLKKTYHVRYQRIHFTFQKKISDAHLSRASPRVKSSNEASKSVKE